VQERKLMGPQHSFLFRVIAFFSRLQLGYMLRSKGYPRFLVMIFVFAAGVIALGSITIIAYLTELPLLFPPLGPSAFILFYTPMSISASPRSVILSHTLALAAGLSSLWFFTLILSHANIYDPTVMDWYRVIVIALSMGLICLMMIIVKCVHPPAAASALIAAMGYLQSVEQIMGFIVAVILLVLEGIFFIKILGGLPYPLWRADPQVARNYGELAGIPATGINFWQQLAIKSYQRR
jgi:CBS-domain-containing membrane protein